jgi:hypothetical protein
LEAVALVPVLYPLREFPVRAVRVRPQTLKLRHCLAQCPLQPCALFLKHECDN